MTNRQRVTKCRFESGTGVPPVGQNKVANDTGETPVPLFTGPSTRTPPKKKAFRRQPSAYAVGLILLAFFIGPGDLRMQLWGQNPPPSEMALNVAFNASQTSSVNRADAMAAIKVLSEEMGRKQGYILRVDAQVIDNDAQWSTALAGKTLHVAILNPWDFLDFDVQRYMDPLFVTAVHNRAQHELVLLTNKQQNRSTLSELRGTDMTLAVTASSAIADHWLQLLLQNQGLGSVDKFFRSVEVFNKPSMAIMPVFFGKKAGCIVSHAEFELLKELNPQLGATLQVISQSEPLVSGLICLSRKGWATPTAREDYIDTMRNLDNNVRGKQVLTIFKIGKLLPFREEDLESVKRLRAQSMNPLTVPQTPPPTATKKN